MHNFRHKKKITHSITVFGVLRSSVAGFFCLQGVALLVLAPFLFSLRFWTPPVTSLMVYRALFNGYEVQPLRTVSLKNLPPWVPRLFIFLEDRRFYNHPGIDLNAIKTAYERNRALGRAAFGGSTITQQLARTLFLTPHKNYFRKYMEVLIALEMDALVPKQRIMELYLNFIEWGPGIFGIGKAAEVYYRKSAERLTVDQYCRLAAVLPNPLSYNVRTIEKSKGILQRYQILQKVFS